MESFCNKYNTFSRYNRLSNKNPRTRIFELLVSGVSQTTQILQVIATTLGYPQNLMVGLYY